ncbi:hypothetical protein [Devosia crocina]|nr:hypothetical protein [Devosia crocina]
MTLDRALEIVGAIADRYIASEINPDHELGSLEGVSLRDMLDACDIVQAENISKSGGARTIHVVPDPRLIAAVYAFENYQPSRTAILSVRQPGGHLRMMAVINQRPNPMHAANEDAA